MYKIQTANNRTEKRLRIYLQQRDNIKNKLNRLKIDPRRELDAHPLHGRLSGKWSCWLSSNIRIIYSIKDIEKTIIIEAIGTHKIY